MSDPVLDAMRSLAARAGTIPPGGTLLVAVSGGQDSCALLHALATLRDELGLSLYAAHVHHGIRGAEADADAEFVLRLAGSLGVPCVVGWERAPDVAQRLHLSIQEAARRVRHQFLGREADRVEAPYIALGHTLDDRIETVLLNILRGTGPEGLRGLAPVAGRRVRPLLLVARDETAAYCRRHGLEFRHDPSNVSPAYARSRVRTELLPHVAAYYNPAIRQALLRLSELASDECDVVAAMAEQVWGRVAEEPGPGRVVLASSALAELPVALRRRIVRMAVARARGDLQDLAYAAVQRALDAADEAERSARTVRVDLFADTYVRAGPRRVLVVHQGPASARRLRRSLPVPGEAEVAELGVRVRAERCVRPDPMPPLDGALAVLDAGRFPGPLTVRTRQPGDRFQPFGMTGHRKLQDFLVDRKVPAEDRDRVLLVADETDVLWVVGYGLSERARATPDAEQVLRLQVEPLA